MNYNAELEKYKKLLDAGVLSQEEFEQQKERLEKEKRVEEITAEKKTKDKKRRTKIIITAVACIVCLAFIVKVVVPTIKYNKALSLIEEGKYLEAYNVLKELNGPRDKQKMQEIWPQANMERMQSAEIGDYVTFGSYPQSSSDSNEKIEWLVLDKKDGKLLLISKYVLDARPYNNPYEAKKTTDDWDSSWIRGWLNNEFMEKAFDSFEQSHIEHSVVKGIKNNKSVEKDTFDKVFLLSWDELETYFSSDEARDAIPTEYAKLEDVPVNKSWGPGCFWLTRGHHTVWPGGGLDAGFGDDYRGGIRPALWLDPNDTKDVNQNEVQNTEQNTNQDVQSSNDDDVCASLEGHKFKYDDGSENGIVYDFSSSTICHRKIDPSFSGPILDYQVKEIEKSKYALDMRVSRDALFSDGEYQYVITGLDGDQITEFTSVDGTEKYEMIE